MMVDLICPHVICTCAMCDNLLNSSCVYVLHCHRWSVCCFLRFLLRNCWINRHVLLYFDLHYLFFPDVVMCCYCVVTDLLCWIVFGPRYFELLLHCICLSRCVCIWLHNLFVMRPAYFVAYDMNDLFLSLFCLHAWIGILRLWCWGGALMRCNLFVRCVYVLPTSHMCVLICLIIVIV
jgi:hypothetical protein